MTAALRTLITYKRRGGDFLREEETTLPVIPPIGARLHVIGHHDYGFIRDVYLFVAKDGTLSVRLVSEVE